MLTKISILAGLFLLIIVVTVSLGNNSPLAARLMPQAAPTPGTLDWYAQQAIDQGAEGYEFSAGEVEYSEPSSWDDVLAHFTIIRVQLVTANSYSTLLNRSIETWYRFRVLETISQKPVNICTGCPSFRTPPAEMLPLQANEILVPKLGGSLTYNGVTLNAKELVFPDFLSSQTYLLILELDTSSKVGKASIGPAGAYTINANGIMQPVNPGVDIYHDVLTNRYGNSVDQLRNALNPPPSSAEIKTPWFKKMQQGVTYLLFLSQSRGGQSFITTGQARGIFEIPTNRNSSEVKTHSGIPNDPMWKYQNMDVKVFLREVRTIIKKS